MTDRAKVKGYITRELITLTPELEVMHAVHVLLKSRISGAPVVDASGSLCGILTAKDCFRAILHASYHQTHAGLVSDYMATGIETLDADLDVYTAAEKFLAVPYRRFPVLQDGRLVGMITRVDLLRAFVPAG